MADRPLLITHRNCFDGVTAAWAYRYFNGDDFDWKPVNFGDDEIPDTRKRVVYMMDFSYDKDITASKIILPSKRTVIMDHHKTAEAELEGMKNYIREKHGVNRQADEIIFDMHRSGAGIAWDYFERKHGQKRGFHSPRHNGVRDNWLVNAVEDRDLWNFTFEDTKEIIAYLATQPMTMEAWDDALELGREEVAKRGASILAYIENFGDKAIKTAKVENVLGYEVPTMNVQYMNCSDHLNKLLKETNAQFVVGYFRRSDGLWQYSFRSQGEFDVSEIARRIEHDGHRGGGHKNASGAQAPVLPWLYEETDEKSQ